MVLFLLGGCFDFLTGVTSPDIADASVLAVADNGLDLSGTRYESGAYAGVYLATLAGEPLDAALTLSSPSNGDLLFEYEGDGGWSVDELEYVVGESYAINRDGVEILRAEAAPGLDLTLPQRLDIGTALQVDAGDQDFDELLVTVVDVVHQEEVWDNVPTNQAELFERLADPSLFLEVPADVFEQGGQYAIGVAGLRSNHPADVTNVNTLASVMATGRLSFSPLSVSIE